MSKIKIAVIGADGGSKKGHAKDICKMLNSGLYNTEVVSIYADNREEAEEIAQYANIPLVAENEIDAIDASDAVCITHRNGNFHKKYALIAAEKGKHIFVDKPLACTVEDAKEIVDAAEKNNVVLFSGSAMEFSSDIAKMKNGIADSELASGYVAFPLIDKEEFGGIHFYTHHLLVEASAVFGRDVQEITAHNIGGNIVVIARYNDFPVIMNFAANYHGLHLAFYTKDDRSMMSEISMFQANKLQIEAFVNAVVGNGKGQTRQELLWPVYLSCAIEKSLQTGETVKITYN